MPIYQHDTEPVEHVQRPTPLVLPSATPNAAHNADVQRKRMLFALGILLIALVAVILKDWDFWFPSPSDAPEATVRSRSPKPLAAAPVPPPAAPAHERKSAKVDVPAPAAAPMAAITERAVLPPLQVEVVAGNRHIAVHGKNNSVNVDTGSTTTTTEASVAVTPVVPGGDHMELSPQTTQRVTVSVPPDYPLLARQMKVQGAVSLQALISRDGSIQQLQILSGPGILAAAAREAVKQWHFKPYLLNGQPVETQARITVNFTISTN